MTARRWLEGGVIALAAFASIATSRPRWHVDATLPADDVNVARIVEVEASHAPELHVQTAESMRGPTPREAAPTWPGKATYLVPAGVALTRVSVMGYCGGGCRKCVAPSDAYVRVTSITPVATWKLEVDGGPQTLRLAPKKYQYTRVTVTATGVPRLRIDGDTQPAYIHPYDGGYNLGWSDVTSERQITWTPRLTLEGACPSAAPCAPPADAKLVIDSIGTETHDAP